MIEFFKIFQFYLSKLKTAKFNAKKWLYPL